MRPRPNWSLLLLGALVSCDPAVVSIVDSKGGETGAPPTGDGWRPSVYDWLPDTTWSCRWMYSRDGEVTEVEHTWQFTETEFSTDCGQQIEAAYQAGSISSSIMQEAFNWVDLEGGAFYDSGRHPWYGISADVILAEFCAYESTVCEGFEHVFHRDGEDHMAIQCPIDGYIQSAISCTLQSRRR